MGQNDEQTTMGSGGPRNTARRSAPPHPGSRRIRERVSPPGGATLEDADAQSGEQGGTDGKEGGE